MQELLNQVIVIALAAVPALFVADFAVKLHDRFATAKTEPEQAIPDVSISDDDLMEALASVPSAQAQSVAEPTVMDEVLAIEGPSIEGPSIEGPSIEGPSIEEQAQESQPAMDAADEPAAVEQEQPQIEKFKADRRRILGGRTIRELKSLASESCIPRYSLMTKDQLITALA